MTEDEIKSKQKLENKLNEEHDGVVGKAIKVEAEGEKFVVEATPKDIKKLGETRDENNFLVLTTLFRHILKKDFDINKIPIKDCYIMFEIPIEQFKEEWRVILEESDLEGGKYKLDEEEPETLEDKLIPKIIDKTQDDKEGDDG